MIQDHLWMIIFTLGTAGRGCLNVADDDDDDDKDVDVNVDMNVEVEVEVRGSGWLGWVLTGGIGFCLTQ